jgi:polysaccharide pyruvyl transferase WcaK-like protein
MPDVLLVGAFGQGNPGDEALCAAFLGSLADRDVVVASAAPDVTTRLHGGAAIANRPWTVAAALRRADTVVVGGGTVFKSLRPATGRRPAALLVNACALTAAAHALGKPVAFVGVGAGDLRGRTARRLAGWLVRHADLLVLRDEESAAALTEAGAPAPFWIGADPAWSVRPRAFAPRPAEGRRPTVTVAISHHAGDARLLANLGAALAPLCADHDVRLQPWQADGDDVAIAGRLRERLGRAATVVEAPVDLDDATATFAGDRLVVALRFHALVAAGLAGTPVLAIAHEPKLAGLSRRLRQPSVPVDASADVLTAAVRHALDTDPPSVLDVQRETAAARHTLELLRLLLDGGDLDEPHRLAGLPLSAGSGTW